MKRIIDYYLNNWRTDASRQPLILNGARQVGKTHAVRELGASFENFVEINFERSPAAAPLFDVDLDPKRIIQALSLLTGKEIIPGTTLLFFDEVQEVPKALLSLRYFYEEMRELHVIAAGSLLDFTLEKIGEPVGRVESLHMYPLSFMEYLAALEEYTLLKEILIHEPTQELIKPVHEKTLRLLAQYIALGGMPAVITSWLEKQRPRDGEKTQKKLLTSYTRDFSKYAKKHQIEYVSLIFQQVHQQLSKKFKFSAVGGEYRKRELQPALNLLETAGIVHKVFDSAGQGLPLKAQADPDDYKAIFLDVGLAESILGLDVAQWFLNPFVELVNKGALVEAFVGQELLAYGDPFVKGNLFYWHRKAPSSNAEIDYLIQQGQYVIPVEVKSGHGTTLRSMHAFLQDHAQSPYGIRFSENNYSIFQKLHSYPLYAIAKVASQGKEEIRESLEALMP